MHQREIEPFRSTLTKTQVWLKEIMEDLDWDDAHAAYLALKGVLHGLRDRLPVDEAAQLGAQLPMLVRGLYYEGWHAAGKPVVMRHEEEFLGDAIRYFGKADQRILLQWNPGWDAEAVVRAVFRVLSRHTTEAAALRHCIAPAQSRQALCRDNNAAWSLR